MIKDTIHLNNNTIFALCQEFQKEMKFQANYIIMWSFLILRMFTECEAAFLGLDKNV